jgi:hypothetical protein
MFAAYANEGHEGPGNWRRYDIDCAESKAGARILWWPAASAKNRIVEFVRNFG